MKALKNLLLRNWRPKLICLLLAIGIWMIVSRHRSSTGRNGFGTPFSPQPVQPPQVEERQLPQ